MTHHQLFILDCGVLIEPDGEGGTYRIPVPAYLIRSAAGRTFLVDTGNPEALIGAADCAPWYGAKCEISPSDDPLARLAELGIDRNDVDAIIATHFDFDHAGRYDTFGPLGTEVWVQRAQLASALSDRDRYDEKLWNIPGLRWRQFDGDVEIEPGLTLLRTDGHAVGHQSIALKISTGWVILAVDAIDSSNRIENRVFPDYYDNVAETNASIDRLLALRDKLGAVIIYGHDMSQWQIFGLEPCRVSPQLVICFPLAERNV